MKNIFNKNKALILGIFLLTTAFVSCVKDKQLSVTEPDKYTVRDIKSYTDLFEVFWTTMNQQYTGFFEEYKMTGLDWDAVYKEYYPKFAALKTWGEAPGMTNYDINKDTEQAKKYFEDIVDPIIDRHFYVEIKMPWNNGLELYRFYGGMKKKINKSYNPYTQRYMRRRLTGDTIHNKIVLAGNLSSNPDIYYLGISQFALYTSFAIELKERYLSPSPGNKYILTTAEIEANAALNAIQDADERNRVKQFTQDLLNEWNAFFNMPEIKTFNDNASQFKRTEIISDTFTDILLPIDEAYGKLKSYEDYETYFSVYSSRTLDYINWFKARMGEHVEGAYELASFLKAVQDVYVKSRFYKYLLNPLRKGDIKKIIIDLRGNPGGNVQDLAFFTNRFVTTPTIYGYQRLKEGNGRFNYTPWTPMTTELHPFGIPSQIPIAVLTDYGSASTSELSTLVLKSQGKQVVSIGDNTRGATAGLGSASDDFNGGNINEVAGSYLKFYIPLLTLKDQNEMLVEGVGIKPNISVTPLTQQELIDAFDSPNFDDKVLNEAIKYLSR